MYDKYVQNIDKAYIDQLLATTPNNTQALVMAAYLEEKQRWEEKVKISQAYMKTLTDRMIELEKAFDTNNSNFILFSAKLDRESSKWRFFLLGRNVFLGILGSSFPKSRS